MIADWSTLSAYVPLMIQGTLTTLQLIALTLVIGFAIALPVAVARNATNRAAKLFGYGFIFFFRGAPLLAILFLVYYGLPQVPGVTDSPLWILIEEPFPVAVMALSLNSAGFQAEIIAGALRNVPRGEIEAARSAGFSRLATFWHVSVAHAVRFGIRGFGNEVVFVVKGTAVVSFITVHDLMSAAHQIYFNTFDPITPLLAAAIIYLAIVVVLMRVIRWLEVRLSPELKVAAKKRGYGRAIAAVKRDASA